MVVQVKPINEDYYNLIIPAPVAVTIEIDKSHNENYTVRCLEPTPKFYNIPTHYTPQKVLPRVVERILHELQEEKPRVRLSIKTNIRDTLPKKILTGLDLALEYYSKK